MEKAKILIVEDEAITADDIHDRLQDLNYAPTIAPSGEQAIKEADAIKPDLVLMDVLLKGMDGIEAAGLIHDHFDIPVIYFTTYIDEERPEKTKVTEPFGYIIKPFGDSDLRPTIEMVLQRHRLEKALRTAEQDWRTAFNSLDDVMLIIDRDYNIEKINEIGLKLLGKSKEEVIGQKCYQVISGADTPGEDCPCRKSLETKKVDSTDRYEARFGKYYSIQSAPIFDENGEIIKFVDLWRDITKRKKKEEELKAQRERIKLINKILRHDIINDLSTINSALRLYERTKEEELLEEASAHVNKSVELINRMRELEIFISSHRDLKLYSVTDVCKNVLKNYPTIAFSIEGEGQVLADESLSSVIDNIIRNAVDHGKTDRIDIKIEERGEYCEIRIADYGVGIPDEIKEQIFEESFAYGETGGAGLGLYIVKKAMETYGGHVRVEDNTPGGAVFVLTLRKVR
jgi:PAS domain S-box-containing protein